MLGVASLLHSTGPLSLLFKSKPTVITHSPKVNVAVGGGGTLRPPFSSLAVGGDEADALLHRSREEEDSDEAAQRETDEAAGEVEHKPAPVLLEPVVTVAAHSPSVDAGATDDMAAAMAKAKEEEDRQQAEEAEKRKRAADEEEARRREEEQKRKVEEAAKAEAARVEAASPPEPTSPTPVAPTPSLTPPEPIPPPSAPAGPSLPADSPPAKPAPPIPVSPKSSFPVPTTSLTVNPVMSDTIFPKADDSLHPLLAPPSSPFYSSFHCIGGRGREGAQKDRSCRWQNLCYRPSTASWLYFQPNTSMGTLPILLDHGKVISTFPTDFIDLTSAAGGKDAWPWAPVQVYGPIPAGAVLPRRQPPYPDVYLLYQPHYGANLGRVLADDLLGLFNLQLGFNALSNTHILLQVQGCETQFANAPRKTALCKGISESVISALSIHPPLTLTTLPTPPSPDLLCFENVLAGMGPLGFGQGLGRAPLWWRFHAFVLENLGWDHNHRPKRQRVTVSLTEGDRALVNQKEVVAYLQVVLGVDVEGVDLHALGGLKDQVGYLLDTTVFVSISGEKAVPALFLPQNAAVVLVDYWDVKAGDVAGTDDRMWGNVGYLQVLWYPFVEAEVVLEGEGKSRERQADMRDYGRVKVDLKRMEMTVRAAFRHVDSFMLLA